MKTLAPKRTYLWELLCLALPFLLVIFLTKGLVVDVSTFHDTDETYYHYPVILQFVKEWPNFNLATYSSATTPFFHLVMAFFSRLIGSEIFKLRLVNAALSFTIVALWYTFLRLHLKKATDALLLSSLLAFSPYFFGRSFRLFTENLAFGLWLISLLLSRSQGNLSAFSQSFFLSLSVLTRQTNLWLVGPLAYQTLCDPFLSWSKKVVRWLCLLLPILVLLPFIVIWQGAVPPPFQDINQSPSPNYRAFLFLFVVLGFYAIFLRPHTLINFIKNHQRLVAFWFSLSIILAISVELRPSPDNDGLLWQVARIFPTLFNFNFFLLFLLFCGLVHFASQIWHKQFFLITCFIFFALAFLPTGKIYQNYYDSYLLILLTLQWVEEKTNLDKLSKITSVALLWLFLGYFIAKAI